MPRANRSGMPARRALLGAALLGSALLGGGLLLGLPAGAQSAPEKPGEPAMGQPHDIEARPALRQRGQSTWDEGFASLRKAIAILGDDARRLSLVPAGVPLAHFVDSDDLGFTYEAYLPLVATAPPDLAYAPGIEPAPTPAGKAMQFQHEGAYDDIDTAYEAITAWLDEKGLQATGRFLEEYLTLPEKSDDPGLKLNIYVFLK